MRILIVDDNDDSREMLSFLLEKNSFDCMSACNGKEGLEILHSGENFDLIISDILMPVMDGYKFCKSVKEDARFQNIYFIFYTATYNEKKDEEFSLSLGAQRFIIKPQEPSVILKIINDIKNELEKGVDLNFHKIEIGETEIYKLYSERLVNKLEKRNIELQKEIQIREEVQEKLLESEERFLLAVDGSQDGIWDWDIVHNKVFFSHRWKEMIGYENSEFENSYENWENSIHQEDKEYVLKVLDGHLKGIIPFYEVEYRMRCKDNSYKWIQSRGKAIFNENNEPFRMAGSHTDISYKKKYEAELIEAKERAEESDKLKSAFLANLSHEIRTPMNGILGFTQLLKTARLSNEDTNEYLNLIEKSTKRLLNIINDLVDISKIDAGQVKINLAVSMLMKLSNIYIPFSNRLLQRKKLTSFSNTICQTANLSSILIPKSLLLF